MIDARGQRLDVGAVDGREHADAQLVASELAVATDVEDPVRRADRDDEAETDEAEAETEAEKAEEAEEESVADRRAESRALTRTHAHGKERVGAAGVGVVGDIGIPGLHAAAYARRRWCFVHPEMAWNAGRQRPYRHIRSVN